MNWEVEADEPQSQLKVIPNPRKTRPIALKKPRKISPKALKSPVKRLDISLPIPLKKLFTPRRNGVQEKYAITATNSRPAGASDNRNTGSSGSSEMMMMVLRKPWLNAPIVVPPASASSSAPACARRDRLSRRERG